MMLSSVKVVSEVEKRPKTGAFSIEGDPLDWIGCRDYFFSKFQEDTESFYFSIYPETHERVAAFIHRTEDILEIEAQSAFGRTNRSYVLWVRPSMFWRKCMVRRSLLTILLRAGLNYSPESDNYEDALYSEEYIVETKDAVLRFFFGFTQFVPRANNFRGWRSCFQGMDIPNIRKRLISSRQEDECLIGAETLWT